jgi:hypothetical protein
MSTERRPSFARAFPASPPLDVLVEAFARGDYAHVRAEAPKLAATSEDDAVRAAAKTLVERTEADPLAVRLLLLTGGLLVLLTGWWIAHGKAPSVVDHAPPSTPAAAPAAEKPR